MAGYDCHGFRIFIYLTNIYNVWNILFMAPRIKMIVIKTFFGAVVVKRCDVSTCYDRSWSRM